MATALVLRQQNKAQFLRRLVARYRAAERLQACRWAWVMLDLLDRGEVTQAQMLNAWNLTAPEWATRRTNRLQPRADKWAAAQSAAALADTEGVD